MHDRNSELDGRTTRPRLRAWRVVLCSAMSLTTACHDGARTGGSNQANTSTSTSSGTSEGAETESGGPGESEGGPWPAECGDADAIPDLPYAIAWRTRLDDGSTSLGVRVQSWPATCETLTAAVPASQTRVEFRLPMELETPAWLELVDARAIAYIAAGGPGSTDTIFELRFLRGPIAVAAFDSDKVVGSLHTEVVPFVGCFEAPVCDDES